MTCESKFSNNNNTWNHRNENTINTWTRFSAWNLSVDFTFFFWRIILFIAGSKFKFFFSTALRYFFRASLIFTQKFVKMELFETLLSLTTFSFKVTVFTHRVHSRMLSGMKFNGCCSQIFNSYKLCSHLSNFSCIYSFIIFSLKLNTPLC